MRSPLAIVFDMDGVLIDSEPLWVRAEIEIFGRFGAKLTETDCARTKGLRIDDVIAFWHERHALTGTPTEIEASLIERVASLVRTEGQALRGVDQAVARARTVGRVALASSSPTAIIAAALERLGLDDAFEIIASAETEPLGKPHPGVFLRTAERLGVRPVDCLVIEDSLNGVIAAKSARMTCIAVPFDHPHHDPRFALADRIIGSLEELTPDLLAMDSR